MSNALDLSSLIRGLLAVIGIAIALGQYPKLEYWSREQAAESIAWKHGLPHFFAHVHTQPKLHHEHLSQEQINRGVR